MKRIFTTLITVLICTTAFSQIQLYDKNGDLADNDTITFWFAIDSTAQSQPLIEAKKFVFPYNATNDTMLIDVTRVKVQGISGIVDQLCWGTNCYVEPQGGLNTWVINDPVKTNPMDTAAGDIPITVYLDNSNEVVGEGYYRYDFIDVTPRSSFTSSITINFSLSYLTGLSDEEIAQFGFDIYPNPANENTVLNFKSELNFREQYVEILDITGKRVALNNVPVGSKKFNLNTQEVSSGIYFVRLVAEGVQVETKKIIIE